MRITDVYFLSTIILAIVAIFGSLIFSGHVCQWLTFWWVILLPVFLIRFFFPSSKITAWLEKERFKTKRKMI